MIALPAALAATVTLGPNTGWYAGIGTLALINAGLAQGKGRSGLNWFLVSLFLGPIATLCLVAFCDPLEPELESHEQ